MISTVPKLITLTIIFFLLTACSSAEPTPVPAPPTGSAESTPAPPTNTPNPTPTQVRTGSAARIILSYNDLMNGFDAVSPVDEAALALPADAASPAHIFEGRLELHGEDTTGEMIVIRADSDQEPEVSHLPEFDFEFVQSDGYLIPVQRGLIIADHPYWNYILEPGRVWGESGDQGYSRASFPFALVWKGSNAILNGTMTFIFNAGEISKVWYQITQETTISFSADMWGLLDATYHPDPVADASQIREAFARELAGRFPTRPIEQLAEDYPGVDISAFGRGVSPRNRTWYGFVVNGVNYMSGCQSRYGEYPYCEFMRAPSYSTAKSAFVSMALMRLAQKYDPAAPDLLIKDYVPEASNSPGDWSAVTFDHVLDMATGNYETARWMVDEEHWDTDPFWNEEYYAEKIAAAFNWPHSADPGTQWVYRTFDTFILTRALQNYLQTLEGPDADIYEFVVDEVYKTLKMGPGVFTTLRTKDDNWQGQPYGGYGLWWIPDDLAKIANFLNADWGAMGGQQILHPDLLAAALQRDPDDRGVENYPGGRYNNAFWADSYGKSDGFDCEFWVAEMQGFSGIVVILMPNGASYYYASDGREFTWDAAVREADKIIPFCPQPAGTETIQVERQATGEPALTSTSRPTLAGIGDTWTRPADGMVMVYVPGGTFQLGSTIDEIDAAIALCREHYNICNRWYYMREDPRHAVTLDGFWLDQTEVTNAQYRRCVEDGVCLKPRACKGEELAYANAEKSDHPVVCMSWPDAQAYCQWTDARLPTEAEWEYAFRGESGLIYPWGDQFAGDRLNYCDANCEAVHADNRYDDGYANTSPVGSYPAGASWSGALGMAGNVSEWVADWLGDYTPDAETNPTGPLEGNERVLKGCSWFFQPAYCRGATRASVSPDTRLDFLGFRCAVSLAE